MKKEVCLLVSVLFLAAFGGESARTVKMLPGENWWGVANYAGGSMPFNASTKFSMDLRKNGHSNQYASFMVSDMGRAIWCERQAEFRIAGGEISVKSDGSEIELDEEGGTLRDVFRRSAKRWFPSSGRTPDLLFFSAPQYNTWIELTYHQNERDILAYAKSMLDNGLPPGVLMIDDTWQAGYGDWRFEPSRFADPKGMIDKLHGMGFKVILWMCPYVGMDTPSFRRIAWGVNPDSVKGWPTKGGFLMKDGKPACVEWWNGFSAYLDFTHPNANAWFREQLDRLVSDYGADGFKFDGGHLPAYTRGYGTYRKGATSGEQVLEYAKFALEYPVCEYRNAWRFQGQPVVERLHDKRHRWGDLRKLIPDMIAGGLLGHPFMCPDMIGGGEWRSFLPGSRFDAELFVRSAQVHALCPMMQFSASPWRVLKSEEHRQIVRDAVALRQKFAPRFVDLAKECGRTGEPMLRSLEYNFPRQGYADVKDEFMMGDFLLVAPQVRGTWKEREVVVPPGDWLADDGTTVKGPAKIKVKTPLSRLPHFIRLPLHTGEER